MSSAAVDVHTPRRPAHGWMRRAAGRIVEPPGEGATLGSWLAATPLHVWLLLLGLTSSMFSGWSGHLGLPISLDRLFFPVALVLLFLDGTRRRQRTTAVHWLMLAFVTWIVVDMVLRGTVTSPVALFALADRVVLPFLMFLAAPLAFSTPFRRSLLLAWLTVIGGYLGVTAVLETFAPALVVPSYITDPHLGDHPERAGGPMQAGDAMGVSCLTLAAVATVFALQTRGAVRVVAIAVAFLDLFAVVLSQTRAVWLAALVAVVAVFVLVPAARRWIPAAIAAGALGAAAVVLALPSLVDQLTGRFEEKGPVYDRLGSNDSAFAVLRDLPLTGIGWRRFFPHGSEWFRQSDAYPTNAVVLEVHNVILSRAAELGLIAAAIFVLILVLGPGRPLWTPPRMPGAPLGSHAHKSWRVLGSIAFIGWFVAGLLGPLAIPFPTLLTFLVCGVATGDHLLLEDQTPDHHVGNRGTEAPWVP